MATRWLGSGAAVLAALSMVVPAEAQDRRGDRRDRQHHRDRDRDRDRDEVDAGSFALGALIVGGIALAASSAARRERAALEASAGPPPIGDPYAVPIAIGVAAPFASADAAVDACVTEVEASGRGVAMMARVTDIDAAEPGEQGWYVRGLLELRQSYRDPAPLTRGFRCTTAGGAPGVSIDGYDVAG